MVTWSYSVKVRWCVLDLTLTVSCSLIEFLHLWYMPLFRSLLLFIWWYCPFQCYVFNFCKHLLQHANKKILHRAGSGNTWYTVSLPTHWTISQEAQLAHYHLCKTNRCFYSWVTKVYTIHCWFDNTQRSRSWQSCQLRINSSPAKSSASA